MPSNYALVAFADVMVLQRSSETRKPVRVIRGYKLHSPYAPAEGYRYDGLYTVEAVRTSVVTVTVALN